jgi:hypothetical protein
MRCVVVGAAPPGQPKIENTGRVVRPALKRRAIAGAQAHSEKAIKPCHVGAVRIAPSPNLDLARILTAMLD